MDLSNFGPETRLSKALAAGGWRLSPPNKSPDTRVILEASRDFGKINRRRHHLRQTESIDMFRSFDLLSSYY